VLSGCTVFVRTNQVSAISAARVPANRVLTFQEKLPNSFVLQVTRDEGFMGGGCYIGLEIEGYLAGRFDTGETATFYLPTSTPKISVVPDPFGRGLCGIAGWTPVPENYVIKNSGSNLYRISLGAYRRPRLLPGGQ
jgi:hypothetical protein